MRYWGQSPTILGVVLLAACHAHVVAPPTGELDVSPQAVYAAVRKQAAAVQALRARFTARVDRASEVRRADGVLLVKKPDRFRLRLLSPFGLTVFDYTSWDTHDRMQLPLEGKQFADAEIAAHSLFSPADMRAVFLGPADGTATRCTAIGGSTETVVDCRDPGGALSRLIRIQSVTRRVEQEIQMVAGQPQVVMQYGDYRAVKSVELPFAIDLTYPEKGVHLAISVRSYDLNPNLPDSLFEPPQSNGTGS
jgi:hypothetical protein